MKKTVSFLFVFSLVCTLSGQITPDAKEKNVARDLNNLRHTMHLQRNNPSVMQQQILLLKTETAAIKLDSIVGLYADSAGAMPENDFRYQFGYDANGMPVLEYQSSWDNNAWRFERRIENTFNPSGQRTIEVYSDWKNNQWEYDYKYEYTWGTNGKVTLEIDYAWDSSWDYAYKYEYTYDANNNMLEELESEWYSGAWEQTDKNTFAYNANNQITQELDFDWDGNQWVYDWKTEYTYDSNDFLILEENFYWTGTWMNAWKEEFTNDANGRPIETIESSWMGGYWSIEGKKATTYDTNGNITEEIYYDWYSNAYHEVDKEVYTYDLAYSNADMWLPLWFDEFNNKVVDVKNYEYDNGAWVLIQPIDLYYSATPFGISEDNIAHIELYPNPTTGLVYLNGTFGEELFVSVLDLSGMVVQRQTITDSNQYIDLRNSPSGMYILKILDGNKVLILKVVKY
jgi:hypothetical protein